MTAMAAGWLARRPLPWPSDFLARQSGLMGRPWHVRPEGSRFRAPERAAKLVWMRRLPFGAVRFNNLFPVTDHTR